MARRTRFTDTTPDRSADLAGGYRDRNPAFDKPFLKRQMAEYKGLPKIKELRGKSDRQLYDIAAKAVLLRNKVGVKTPKPDDRPDKPRGGGDKPRTPRTPKPRTPTKPRAPKAKTPTKPRPKAQPKPSKLAHPVPKSKIIPEIRRRLTAKERLAAKKRAYARLRRQRASLLTRTPSTTTTRSVMRT